MADNTSFLTPLLASCGAIAAFCGTRHQHLSGLIRKKTEHIFSQYNDLKPAEVENMMAQITLLRYRNGLIESAAMSSLFGGFLFAACIVSIHFTSAESILVLLICLGLFGLLLSLYIAIEEFTQSSNTLDLEIFLSSSKYRKTGATEGKLGINNLLMYGQTEEQQKEYLKYLLNQAKAVAEKKRGRVANLLESKKARNEPCTQEAIVEDL
jgi:hypothetical protein